MKEKPIFCEKCPRLPKGVIAEIVNVEFMNRRSLPGFRGSEDERGEISTLVARIDTVAVQSSNESIEQGAEGELYVLAGSITGNEIKEKVMDCLEPSTSLFGGRKCQAIEDDEVLDVL